MPKKKRKSTDGANSRVQDHEEESRGESDAKLKRSFGDAFIVISDSDGEQESKEEDDLQKKRTKQQLERTKFAAKKKIAQMTEDEQFALALKMSEQEAKQMNSQEEEEEELLRKAIAESLNSCQPCDSSVAAALPPLTQAPESPPPSHLVGPETSELHTATPPPTEPLCSKGSHKADENGQADVAKRPLVVLTRLSQETVERSLVCSITLSPGRSQPFARSNEGASSPAGSDSSDTLPNLQDLCALSPTFPRRPQGAWPLAPRRLFAGQCSPPKPASQEIENHSQNCSEKDPLPGCSEALVKVPQKYSTLDHHTSADSQLEQQIQLRENADLSTESLKGTEMPGNAPPLCTLQMADEEGNQEEDQDTVHYYWGVPFCPKGVDPNKYTQVILCQLEVYQKSLKQAQRQLLQKKRFGEPVVPNSCSLSQSDHGMEEEEEEEHIKGNGSMDEREREDMDDEKEPWLLSPANGELDKNPKQNAVKGENSEHGDEPVSSSCQASQVLFAEDVLEEGEPMQITQSISALTPLDRRSPDTAAENHAEEEITVCPETQPSPSQAIEPESREIHSSSKDVSLQADADEDAGKGMSAPSLPADGAIQCPMCDRRFPVLQIERHAMYCNGSGEDTEEDAPVMTRRQREAKSRAAWVKETSQSVDTGKYEKCYICKTLVPMEEYQKHVDGCLPQQCSKSANGTQGGKRLRRAKEQGKCDGRLLNMLEKSEHKAADAETGTTPSGEDLRCCSSEMDKEAECGKDDWSHFPHPSCSGCPVKTFTCISEAKSCLVDVKKQLATGSGSRQQTKASFRRRKKL